MDDYANNGLDSAAQYLGGSPISAFGGTVAEGAAFPGQNPLLGSGSFQLPIGKSAYDALQIVYRQQKAHPLPGIEHSNMQVSYNLSKITSTSGGGSDQFFGGAGSFDNDNPVAYMGRAGLINSGGESHGASDLKEAVRTAVINKRAGGMGLISGRKSFQRPMKEGVELLHAIQDVYLNPAVTVA